jgi:hypothetical protein
LKVSSAAASPAPRSKAAAMFSVACWRHWVIWFGVHVELLGELG